MNDDLFLWPNGVPGGINPVQVERMGPSPFVGTVRYNVTTPRLELRRPSPGTSNGAAAIICPGGGFHFLTMDNEGYDLADILVARGVTCAVLSYRLIATPTDPEEAKAATLAAFLDGANRIDPFIEPLLSDGPEGVRILRSHATSLDVDPARVAMIGFSAGARITATAALDSSAGSRPDLAAIVYLPTMPAHSVPTDAAPLFVVAAADDQIGTAGNEELYASWRAAGRPAEMHLFERGGHGFGVRPQGLPSDAWAGLLTGWLASYGYLTG